MRACFASAALCAALLGFTAGAAAAFKGPIVIGQSLPVTGQLAEFSRDITGGRKPTSSAHGEDAAGRLEGLELAGQLPDRDNPTAGPRSGGA